METFQQGNGERNTVKVVCCVRRGEHVPAHVVGRFLPYVRGRASRPHGHRGGKEPTAKGSRSPHGKDAKVHEMRTAETLLNIIQDRGKRNLPLDEVYRQLSN